MFMSLGGHWGHSGDEVCKVPAVVLLTFPGSGWGG